MWGRFPTCPARAGRPCHLNMKGLQFTPLVLALAASAFWLTYHSGELLRVNGPWVLVVLAFPVVVSAAPVVFAGRAPRGVAAAVLCAFALIASMSVGTMYLHAALAMVVARLRARDAAGLTPHPRGGR